MSVFTSKLRIVNPAEPARTVEVELTVDTGASYSWVSRLRLKELGIRPTDRMEFRTIEGRIIEREVAPVFLQVDGRIGGDTVVVGEPGDMEVMGAHSLEALGLAVDPVQKRLVRTVGYALTVMVKRKKARRSRVVEAIDAAIEEGRLREPFSNEDFRAACSGFGQGTYNAFLWKHSVGNPGRQTIYFERVGKNQFQRVP